MPPAGVVGSVFTRKELQERERKQLMVLADRLQREIASLSLQQSQSTQLGSGSDAVDHGTQGRVRPRSARSGCCGAQASPSASLAMAGVVIATLLRRRRRTKSCGNCSRH